MSLHVSNKLLRWWLMTYSMLQKLICARSEGETKNSDDFPCNETTPDTRPKLSTLTTRHYYDTLRTPICSTDKTTPNTMPKLIIYYLAWWQQIATYVMLHRRTEARRKGKTIEEGNKPRLIWAQWVYIDEYRDWTNALLRNIQPRFITRSIGRTNLK